MGAWSTLGEGEDFSDLKHDLPIDWVIQELWNLTVTSAKQRCPNPEHIDGHPSWNVYASNGHGVLDKHSCYGCGFRGDIFDVIRETYNISFYEAVGIARDVLLPKFNGTEWNGGIDNKVQVSPEELEENWRILSGEGHDTGSYYRFLAMYQKEKHIEFGKDFYEYPVHTWKWQGLRSLKALAMPHFAPTGEVNGVKLRDSRDIETKWGLVGSHYPWLYGSWRDTSQENVVLCEGETDTVYMAYQMEGRKVDVMGIPTGVRQQPSPFMLEQLRDRRVWIVFDGDDPGQEGAHIWNDALGQPEKRIIVVPNGEDVCSCGIPATELLGLKG